MNPDGDIYQVQPGQRVPVGAAAITASEAKALEQYPQPQRWGLLRRLRRGKALVKPGYESDGVLDARTLLPVAAKAQAKSGGGGKGTLPGARANPEAYAASRGARTPGVARRPRSCLPKSMRR